VAALARNRSFRHKSSAMNVSGVGNRMQARDVLGRGV
jgi:hypothetical protein